MHMNGPLDLTFGVELEFIVRVMRVAGAEQLAEVKRVYARIDPDMDLKAKHATYHAVSETLRTIGFQVYLLQEATRAKAYEEWTVGSDHSILAWDEKNDTTRYSFVTVEVKSPVLLFNDSNITEVRRAMHELNKRHKILLNETCGFHVHIGNLTRGFPLATLRTFAEVVTVFERQLHTLHPSHRHEDDWSAPPSSCLSLSSLPRLEQARIIAETQHLEHFLHVMHPFYSRHQAYNFVQLDPQRPDGLKTIEFRQHEGTMDPDRAGAWITVAAGLVQWAHTASPVDLLRLLTEHANDYKFDVLALFSAVGLARVKRYYKRRLCSPLVMSPLYAGHKPDTRSSAERECAAEWEACTREAARRRQVPLPPQLPRAPLPSPPTVPPPLPMPPARGWRGALSRIDTSSVWDWLEEDVD
ncbi:MAG: hypothetical protein M1832_001230 [Thelocarpon impressellum]|nr:MAG: hypothetical protein M1832_001230 [Thelocarpon impressellum]